MPASALEQLYGLVAKSTSDQNFVEAWKGCQEAAMADGNRCVLLGDEGPASPHIQRYAIEQALASGQFSALAVSVTNSEFVAQSVAQADIPILTFDSPFAPRNRHLQKAYVGTDNEGFGRDLAMLTKWLKPDGGSLCIFTVEHDPNLALRVQSLRQELAGETTLAQGQALAGEGGWHELERCPTMSQADNTQAITQLQGTLSAIHPDVIVSVGHWAVEVPDNYRATTGPYRQQLLKGETLFISGVGHISAAYQALISDGLVHGMVSIDFAEIGRITYQRMKEAAAGETLPATTFTPNRFVPPEARVKPASAAK